MQEEFYTISQASKYLNVSIDTLRRWDKSDKLKCEMTLGGHRRYKKSDLDNMMNIPIIDDVEKINLIYSRVSSNEQKTKGDLDRQSQRLMQYCIDNGILVSQTICDVGSGLNDNRQGLNKLTDLIISGNVEKLIIENKDRLTRFQYNFICKVFKSYGCEVVVIDDITKNDDDELVNDMLSLIASFSGRFYGKRSAKRRKK